MHVCNMHSSFNIAQAIVRIIIGLRSDMSNILGTTGFVDVGFFILPRDNIKFFPRSDSDQLLVRDNIKIVPWSDSDQLLVRDNITHRETWAPDLHALVWITKLLSTMLQS